MGRLRDARVGAERARGRHGLDVVELGCGTAYFSAWLARRGAAVGRRRPDARRSSRPRGGCRTRPASSFRSSRRSARTCRCPMRRSTSSSPSTARRSGPIRSAGSRRRRGLLRPGGRLVFLTNSIVSRSSATDDGRCRRSGSYGRSSRLRPDRVARTTDEVEFHLAHGEWIALAARERLRARARCVELHATGRARDAHVLRLRHRRVGAKVASRRSSGSRASVADAPPAPPLLLASTSPQRRAILEQLHIPFDVVAPAYEEETPPARRCGRRSCASTRAGRRGPSPTTPTTGRCSASTPRSCSTA